MESIKLHPEKWQKLTDILVGDPDGWDRANFDVDWNREITFDEFWQKAGESTTYRRPTMDYDELKAHVFDKLLQNQTH